MTDERYIKIDVDAEVESYFDASSESHGGTPDFVIVMGGPAVGKTTLRKQMFSKGYVLVDAADIFIRLARDCLWTFRRIWRSRWRSLAQ